MGYFVVSLSDGERRSRHRVDAHDLNAFFSFPSRGATPTSLLHSRIQTRAPIVPSNTGNTSIAAGHKERIWRWPTLPSLIAERNHSGSRTSDLIGKGKARRGCRKKKMGQAWCKEKTSKAQDSKSPLDRVFVRCAHRVCHGEHVSLLAQVSH